MRHVSGCLGKAGEMRRTCNLQLHAAIQPWLFLWLGLHKCPHNEGSKLGPQFFRSAFESKHSDSRIQTFGTLGSRYGMIVSIPVTSESWAASVCGSHHVPAFHDTYTNTSYTHIYVFTYVYVYITSLMIPQHSASYANWPSQHDHIT